MIFIDELWTNLFVLQSAFLKLKNPSWFLVTWALIQKQPAQGWLRVIKVFSISWGVLYSISLKILKPLNDTFYTFNETPRWSLFTTVFHQLLLPRGTKCSGLFSLVQANWKSFTWNVFANWIYLYLLLTPTFYSLFTSTTKYIVFSAKCHCVNSKVEAFSDQRRLKLNPGWQSFKVQYVLIGFK